MIQWGGTAIAVSGAMLVTVINYSEETSTSSSILIGNLLLLVWVTSAAVAIVLQKPLLK